MMSNRAACGLVVIATLVAAPTFGQSFIGEWTATATTPGGEVSETLSVAKAAGGYAITATLIGVPEGTPTAGPGTDIVLDGGRFSYKRVISTPHGEVVLTYSGSVSGDTFTGTAQVGGFEVPYSGVRLALPAP
jgi:hypothetical protein